MSKLEQAFVNNWGDEITDWSYNELIHRVRVFYDDDGKQRSMVIENPSDEFVDWLEENC